MIQASSDNIEIIGYQKLKLFTDHNLTRTEPQFCPIVYVPNCFYVFAIKENEI
jgi:hypothetical protein